MKKLLTICIVLICSNVGSSKTFDDGFNWEGQETEGKPKWYFLNEMVDTREYERALYPTVWLLQHTPNLHKSLYIQASKVLEANVKLTKEKNRKMTLQDSALWVYDQRMKLYGEKAKCLNKKGKIAFKYLYARKGTVTDLYGLYKKVYELNGQKMYINSSTSYFRAAQNMFVQHKISKDEVLGVYSEMISYLDAIKVKYSGKPKKLVLIKNNRAKIEGDFEKHIPLNCQEVNKYYGAKYVSNPSLEDAKKINSFLAKEKCFGDQLFVKTNEDILAQEPDAKRFAAAAILASNNNDYDKSYSYYEKAVELEDRDTLKAKFLLAMARIKYQQGAYVLSRSNARASIALKSENPEAYKLIGDLYMSGQGRCQNDDVLVQKSIYIAAFNMYKIAGDKSRMAQSREQFPTMEEIFVRNKKEGDNIHVNCWIDEDVKLQRK